MSSQIVGKCLCERVGFTVAAPSLWCAHCHCTMCRRAHGAAFVTWVGYPRDAVAFVDPEGVLRWYQSSTGAERGFCSHCGSMLFFRSERWAGELHVTRASIAGDIDRAPEGHAYYDTHVDWVSLADDLPRR